MRSRPMGIGCSGLEDGPPPRQRRDRVDGARNLDSRTMFFCPKPYLNINVYAGYRFLHVEYKKIAEIDVDIKGPFLGLAFEFSSE